MAGMVCTVTTSKEYLITEVKYDITTDSAAGTATGAADPTAGLLIGFETDPGSAAPTDNWDFTVTQRSGGADLLGGAGADRDTTTTEYAVPLSPGGVPIAVAFKGPLTVNVSNAGNSKTLVIYLYFINELRQ